MPEVLSTSELLNKLATEHKRNKISIREIKSALHERGFGMLFLVFALPLLIPIPVPTGLGTALSVPIFFFAYQLTINVDSPWLPKWVLRKEINIETFRKIVAKSQGILKFVEKFLKERVLTVSDSRRWEIAIGIFIMLLNIPIAFPMPLSNTLPAASIIVISFGMIEKDGLMILIGKVIGIISWLVFIAMCYAIFYGAGALYDNIPETLRDDIKGLEQKFVPDLNSHKYDIEFKKEKYLNYDNILSKDEQ